MRRVVILLPRRIAMPLRPAARHRSAALPDRRRARAGHAPDRHDRQRHPLHGRPDRQRLRRLPVRRLPDLRAADRVGPHPRRPARAAGARARRVVGGAQGRADEVGVQAAQGRDVPRRQPVQRGRGGLLVRVDQEEGRAALRSRTARARSASGSPPHRRSRRSTTTRWSSRPTSPPASCRTRSATCSSCRRPSGRRSRTGASSPSSRPGTGPFRVTKFVPARAARAGREQELLGRQAPAQDRQARAAAAAGADHAAGRAAQRAGGLDRGAAARTRSRSSRAAASRSRSTAIRTTGRHTLRLDKEPWSNKLVRKAANYAIDRVGICKNLLNDTCIPATGVVYKGHPWFGKPKETYDYNPAKAKELLRQAGFDAHKHPAKAVAPHLDLGLGPDAAARDERAHPEEPQGRGHRRGPAAGGVEHAAHALAGRLQDAGERGPQRLEHLVELPRAVERLRPVLPQQVGGAGRRSTRCPTSTRRRTSSSTRRSGPSTWASRTRSSPGSTRWWSTTRRGSSWCTTRTRGRCPRR